MSMTLWVHILEGRQITAHEDDHSLMNKFVDELDAVCKNIGVAPLSSFLDYTDLNANLTDDETSFDAEEINSETGWSYGIDDMAWFPVNEGVSTLSSLRMRLSRDGAQSIPEKVSADLLDELDSCIAKLSESAPRDAKFHLAVVM